ncbi:MAG: trypsin-like peptidase domain-containing protein [Thermoguttaceae bacterium]
MLDRSARKTSRSSGRRLRLLACAAVLLVLPGLAAASEQRITPIVKAAQKAKPSVVSIRGEKTILPGPQTTGNDAPRRVNGMGTGVVIDSRGYILTNYHVVDGVREIQVTTSESKKYIGTIVARDAETDLAVIKISPADKMEEIALGTSSDLMQGETVIAVGNAFGYDFTVTRGIVSALHRAVQINDAQYYDDLIQTDAPINPGNSGGPLLNIDGEMIGVNVAVRAGAQGIGFAIPVDKAMNIAATLLASSSAKSWHGLVAAPDAPASLSGMKLATIEKKSPAANAGLKEDDVITAVGETEIHRALDFQRAMLDRKAGDKVDVTVQRDGKSLNLSIVLGEIPDAPQTATTGAWETLGLELRAMPANEFKQKFHTRYRGGLLVIEVRPNSPAAEQGIHSGDVLVGMHIWETVSLENVAYILKRSDFNSITPVKFFILRGNETLYGFMPVSLKVARQP